MRINETAVKADVRERDGYKCRQCGMSNEEHLKEFGRILDVHRLIPGSEYVADWCVTLCRPCHNEMPKSAVDVVWGEAEETGLWMIAINLFHSDGRAFYEAMVVGGEHRGLQPIQMAWFLMREYVRSLPADYCI